MGPRCAEEGTAERGASGPYCVRRCGAAGRREGVLEVRKRTMRGLSRQRVWESLSGQSRPMEAPPPAFGAVPQPPRALPG